MRKNPEFAMPQFLSEPASLPFSLQTMAETLLNFIIHGLITFFYGIYWEFNREDAFCFQIPLFSLSIFIDIYGVLV